MKHIAWFDFLGNLIGQKTIKSHCGLRVKYGQHVNTTSEATCLDCIQYVATQARMLETVLNKRDDNLYN